MKKDSLLYVAGNFTAWGIPAPFGLPFGINSALPLIKSGFANGFVKACVSDGNGGWFIGGNFTQVDGVPRAKLAHIFSNGNVAAWNPGVTGNTIESLLLYGSKLYVGGDYYIIGGQNRTSIAAVDTATGLATSWNPNPNPCYVFSMSIKGNFLYVGGTFNTIGGQTRPRLAAIDTSTGLANSWNPFPNSTVLTLLINGDTVYIGGNFTLVGGQNHRTLAAIDRLSGNPTFWNPFNGVGGAIVNTIVQKDSLLYIGGLFSSVMSQFRNNLAAFNLNTSSVTSFNPNVNSKVQTMVESGGILYIGGAFTSIGTASRNYLASVNITTGLPTSWHPNINGYAYCLALHDTSIYAGGEFDVAAAQKRNHVAAINVNTGQLASWNPNVNGLATRLTANDSMIYIEGLYDSVGGIFRNGLAAVHPVTGALKLWDPVNTDFAPADIKAINNNVYAGGYFSTIGSHSINSLAELDGTTGNANISWNPNPTHGTTQAAIASIDHKGDTLYVAGDFTTISGQSRMGFAAYNIVTHSLLGWSPVPSNSTYHYVNYSNDVCYLSSGFTTINGVARNGLAAVDANSGALLPWYPSFNNNAFFLARQGSKVYLGGNYTMLGGQPRYQLASVDATTGAVSSFDPNLDSGPANVVVPSGDTLYIGGIFTSVNGDLTRRYFMPLIDSTLSFLVSIAATPSPACIGASISFSSTLQNSSGGTTYQWLQNGSPIGGATNSTFTSATITNADTISVSITEGIKTITSNLLTNLIDSTNTWTGAASISWSNPLNWSCGSVPGSSSNVIIPAGASVVISITNAMSNNITVGAGAAVSFSGAAPVLTVGGLLLNNGTIYSAGGTLVVVP